MQRRRSLTNEKRGRMSLEEKIMSFKKETQPFLSGNLKIKHEYYLI